MKKNARSERSSADRCHDRRAGRQLARRTDRPIATQRLPKHQPPACREAACPSDSGERQTPADRRPSHHPYHSAIRRIAGRPTRACVEVAAHRVPKAQTRDRPPTAHPLQRQCRSEPASSRSAHRSGVRSLGDKPVRHGCRTKSRDRSSRRDLCARSDERTPPARWEGRS